MRCPHCESDDTRERRERIELGCRRFRCRTCLRDFNERTGTRFNHLQYPTDIVCLVVLWRVRYKLSLRELPELFLERGIVFTHEAVREWETQLAPVLSAMLRKHRRGRIGPRKHRTNRYLNNHLEQGERASSGGKTEELHQVGDAPAGPLTFDFQRACARIAP